MSIYTRYPVLLNSGNAVTSINGLVGAVTLAAGSNITITPAGNVLTIASTGGGGSGVDTIGTIDSQPASANGAVITGTSLIMQSASVTVPGLVNIAAQTFNGDKTFDDNIIVTGTILNSALTASRAVVTNGSKVFLSNATTATELGYVNGVTSAIQTQLDSKQATLTIGNLTAAGTDGIAVTGGTGSVIGSGTSLAQHVADSTHNGYLSSTDWIAFNAKQAAGNYITALTGDGIASGPGSAALTLATVNANVGAFASVTVNGKGLVTAAANISGDLTTSGAVATLATVNSNVGSFGSSTSIPSLTVNAKGLVTAASGNVVIAPAGTLTGTTLAANVVTSSLTSVGTITSGTWNGTTIAVASGGTGATSLTVHGVVIGNSTSAVNVTSAGTAGHVLTSNGASADPTFQSAPTPTAVAFTATGATTAVSSAANTTIVNPTVGFDTASGYNNSTGVYTVQTGGGGKWNFNGGLRSNAGIIGIIGNTLFLRLKVNGANLHAGFFVQQSTGTFRPGLSVSWPTVNLSVGDTVEMSLENGLATTFTCDGTSQDTQFFSGYKVGS